MHGCSSLETVRRPTRNCATWLDGGTRPDGKPAAPPMSERLQRPVIANAGGADDAETEQRREAIARCDATLEALEAPVKTYTAVLSNEPDSTNFTPDRRWEIASLVLRALGDLTKFVDERKAQLLQPRGEGPGPLDL